MATVAPLTDFNGPPAIEDTAGNFRVLDTTMPLHTLAVKRIRDGRDLKILITADDSETGVGKTTLAGWLALNWNYMFRGTVWDAEELGTLDPAEYFQIVTSVPEGTVVIIDDAEELDARRSMQDMNVKFSWWWMLMRLKQVITILTLPSPAAIDSRLEELADVWINVQSRGKALAHDIGVQSYGTRDVTTKKVHLVNFPDVSEHEQLNTLRKKKREKMDEWDKQVRGELEEDDQELSKTQQTFLAIAVKERESVAWADVPSKDERLTYSGEFYRKQSKELLG